MSPSFVCRAQRAMSPARKAQPVDHIGRMANEMRGLGQRLQCGDRLQFALGALRIPDDEMNAPRLR